MNAGGDTEWKFRPRARVLWMLGVLVILGSALLLHRFNPIEHGFYPKCMFHVMTGLDCPGCGGLRAAHQLLHGNVRAALELNPLLVCMLPIAGAFTLQWLIARAQSGRRSVMLLQKPMVLWSFAIVVITFGLLRNLPWRVWLS